MIKSVYAKNFKGLGFTQEFSRYNIIVGPNGSGKSARSQAVEMAVNGYVASEKAIKQNGSIFDAFGTGDKFEVGISLGSGTKQAKFLKVFSRRSTGTVSINHKTHNGKVDKAAYHQIYGSNKGPAVLDLHGFMSQSDQKKIETIFKLFPPGGDFDSIESEISLATESLNTTNKKIQANAGVIAKLTAQKSKTELPAGNFAEIRDYIRKFQADLDSAEEELKAEEIKTAEESAKEKVRAEAIAHDMAQSKKEFPKDKHILFENPAIKSIEKIITTLQSAGCSACAALLVAKKELRGHIK